MNSVLSIHLLLDWCLSLSHFTPPGTGSGFYLLCPNIPHCVDGNCLKCYKQALTDSHYEPIEIVFGWSFTSDPLRCSAGTLVGKGGHPFFPVNAFLARDLLLPSFTPRRRSRRR